ncbi:MAG: enoyl-CoA hydratase/isomerase family protein, partial [Hyphomonadaceae bacterium]
MELQSLLFRIENGVAHITLNEPERGNPMDEVFTREFSLVASECSVNRDVRAVLIDAAGRYFSVGGDIKSMTRDRGDFPRFATSSTADLHMAVTRFARMNVPVVVAVHALAAGGGVSVAAAADFVLSAPDAKYYAAFLGIGISPDTGAAFFLPRRVGTRRATEFLMRNQTRSARE